MSIFSLISVMTKSSKLAWNNCLLETTKKCLLDVADFIWQERPKDDLQSGRSFLGML